MEERIGTNIKISLQNEYGINKSLNYRFENEICLKIALYNCPKNAERVKNVLNNYDEFNYKWKTEYEYNNLMVFKSKDVLGNIDYLNLKFE